MNTVDPAHVGPDPHAELPPRPERPDCCAGGCATCVLDGYFEDVQRWEAEVAAIQERRRQAAASPDPDRSE